MAIGYYWRTVDRNRFNADTFAHDLRQPYLFKMFIDVRRIQSFMSNKLLLIAPPKRSSSMFSLLLVKSANSARSLPGREAEER